MVNISHQCVHIASVHLCLLCTEQNALKMILVVPWGSRCSNQSLCLGKSFYQLPTDLLEDLEWMYMYLPTMQSYFHSWLGTGRSKPGNRRPSWLIFQSFSSLDFSQQFLKMCKMQTESYTHYTPAVLAERGTQQALGSPCTSGCRASNRPSMQVNTWPSACVSFTNTATTGVALVLLLNQ